MIVQTYNNGDGQLYRLKVGDSGTAAGALQSALNKAGLSVPMSGTFDGPTLRALNAFQRRHGLDETAWVDAETSATLMAILTRGQPAPVTLVTQASNASPAPGQNPTATPPTVMVPLATMPGPAAKAGAPVATPVSLAPVSNPTGTPTKAIAVTPLATLAKPSGLAPTIPVAATTPTGSTVLPVLLAGGGGLLVAGPIGAGIGVILGLGMKK